MRPQVRVLSFFFPLLEGDGSLL
jgi:hypothetical protein